MKNKSPSDRFWEKVDKGFDKDFDCWLWTANVAKSGYGLFHNGEKTVSAHRFAYEDQFGPIPSGKMVLHHCDVRICMRHLYVGDHAQNMQDRHNRGRTAHWINPLPLIGEEHGQCKITDSEVLALRSLKGKIPQRKLGEMFGLSQAQVGRILRVESRKKPTEERK